MTRSPLIHRPGDNLPAGLTPAERDAAAHPGVSAAALEATVPEPTPTATPAVVVPIIPEKVARIAGYVATALGLVGGLVMGATSLPAWVGFAVFAVAAVAGFVAGAGMPSFFPQRPLVSAALAAKLFTAAMLLVQFAPSLPPEPKWIQAGVGVVVAILCALAGKSAPQMIALASKP